MLITVLDKKEREYLAELESKKTRFSLIPSYLKTEQYIKTFGIEKLCEKHGTKEPKLSMILVAGSWRLQQ